MTAGTSGGGALAERLCEDFAAIASVSADDASAVAMACSPVAVAMEPHTLTSVLPVPKRIVQVA